ncbi:hypothetical protein AAG906_029764 [Vitis piasezkii]
MPQAASTDPLATPPVPLAIPPPSQDFITIYGSEFRGMVLLFRTLNATHNQDQHSIILDQHTAILRQIQQHLGLAPLQIDIPGPSKPRVPVEEMIPPAETITADVPPQATHETALEPSCPPEDLAP